MSHNVRTISLLTVGLVVGIAATAGWSAVVHTMDQEGCPYSLINPFRCSPSAVFTNPEYDQVSQDIRTYIEQQKPHGVTDVGVYFRDLRNGPIINIDTNAAYIGASLLKLPILVRYLKDAEGDPKLLETRIVATVDASTTNQGLPVNQTIEPGGSYTIADLLQRMVRYSDNNSRAALVAHYHELHPQVDIILDTLDELGIVNTQSDERGTYVSLRSTASIFRILYNASYLNIEQSQRALTWLTESDYDDGIAKPVPATIKVANKYGLYNSTTLKELHDCGIIYYPNHPYELCVMTKGDNLTVLQSTIASISQIIYTEVDRRFGPK